MDFFKGFWESTTSFWGTVWEYKWFIIVGLVIVSIIKGVNDNKQKKK